MKYVCVHGHFYQPPRENPWLGDVELQESAAPWHDWNERITAECYAPNMAARILGEDGKIVKIISNYERMSFNVGPTLLQWMERHAPETYDGLLEADHRGKERFSNHGPALAQVYNHMIMPLASKRDKITQVLWGLQDFSSRFGRFPEGMWLPETAVDIETLEVLASEGLRFTILAPHQAKAWKMISESWWHETDQRPMETCYPYLCNLPSGRSLAIFFYDDLLAKDIAFGPLLKNGALLAQRLLLSIEKNSEENPLAHVATDGETFGHHHKYGDMALAWCLDHIEHGENARLTVYGEYLEKFPPRREVRIRQNTSWSCVHGVKRWYEDCGCHSGLHPGWNQKWRQPLRAALDWLREKIDGFYEKEGAFLFSDPWKTRDLYVQCFFYDSTTGRHEFLRSSSLRNLSTEEKVRALKLLEMERSAMFMYTSCGWFFDEISGLEALQILLYAYHALTSLEELSGEKIKDDFIDLLERAPSNIEEFKNGGRIFDFFVAPFHVDFLRVGGHYAVQALFQEKVTESESFSLCNYRIKPERSLFLEEGRENLVMGEASLSHVLTGEDKRVFFSACHRGGHKVLCGVRAASDQEEISTWERSIQTHFPQKIESVFVELFGHRTYSLRHLFKDGQRQIMHFVMERDVARIENYLKSVVRDYDDLLTFMGLIRMPLPEALSGAAEVVLNGDLRRIIWEAEPDLEQVEKRLDQAFAWQVEINIGELQHHLRGRIEKEMAFLSEQAERNLQQGYLVRIEKMLGFVRRHHWDVNLWKAQNIYASISDPNILEHPVFKHIGNLLNMRLGLHK
jgi:alpha-amylase/alpha-mannosidase (GH57 family)